MDNNYPPYVFVDDSGKLTGILVDRWKLWEKKTGIMAEIQAMDWNEALRRMRAGEFDVIDTIFFSRERAEQFDFSKPYVKIDVPVYFHKDISGIIDTDTLKGFIVAVKAGDAAVDFLKKKGVVNLQQFNSYEAIIKAAKDRKIAVFVMDKPAAEYYLFKMNIHDNFRHSEPLYTGEFHRAVRRGNTALLNRVEEGFSKISADEYRTIDKKWRGAGIIVPVYLRYTGIAAAAVALLVLLLVARNIVLRKRVAKVLEENEDRWKLFLEHNPIYVFFKDENIRSLQLSKNFEKMVGKPMEELIGKTMYDLFPSDLAKKMVEDDMKVLRDGVLVEVIEEFNGRHYRTIKFPITRKGKPSLLAGFTIDITEQKLAEEERMRLESQLRQAQKMEAIGTLAGGVAHDFNNILTVLIGFGSLLEAQIDDADPKKSYVKQILSSSERACRLTQGLLAFSRKQPVDLRTRDANLIVRNSIQFLEQVLSEDIELKMELTGQNTSIMADGVHLDHVLINLATNARDAMPQGGTLTLKTQVVKLDEDFIKIEGFGKTGAYVMISVGDTGIGMDKKTMDHIFEPFFTTKAVGKGTGLGLSSVYGTIKQHDGYITVKSAPGQGTTFGLYFPLISPEKEHETAKTKHVGENGNETILIVEDDSAVRELISQTLRGRGYNIMEAEDGEVAVHIFGDRKDEIDLVITDVVMPKMNGREVFEEIIKIKPGARVLFTSGYANDTIIEKGVYEGLFEFIPKPLSPEELLLKVREVLDR